MAVLYVLSAVDISTVVEVNKNIEENGSTMCEVFKQNPYPFQEVISTNDVTKILEHLTEAVNSNSSDDEFVRVTVITTNDDGLATNIETYGVTNDELKND